MTEMTIKKEDRDPLTEKIIGACYKTHGKLGPGFVEKIYFNSLKLALDEINLPYQCEKEFNVEYNGTHVGNFRVDFLINDKVILEIKATDGYLPKVFEYQVISYLKATNLKVALLVNFGNKRCQIRRLMLP